MKKVFLLILVLLSVGILSSCNKKEKEIVTVLSPMGTPQLSQMYIENNKEEYNYKIDYVQGSDALSAAFLTKSYDFIYAPLNLGAKMYINNKNYKLLALVVDCNYYLVAKGNSNISLDDIKNMDLVLFGESAMSGIIARYVLSNGGLNDISSLNISYVNSVADSMSSFVKDNSICALISEPQLSILESKVGDLQIINIKEEYKKISGNDNVPQAAVFVRADLDKDVIRRYSSRLEDSIKKINSDIESSASLGSNLFENFTEESLLKAIPRSEIRFTKAKNAIEKCEDFFKLLNNYNPKILDGEIDEEFYYD